MTIESDTMVVFVMQMSVHVICVMRSKTLLRIVISSINHNNRACLYIDVMSRPFLSVYNGVRNSWPGTGTAWHLWATLVLLCRLSWQLTHDWQLTSSNPLLPFHSTLDRESTNRVTVLTVIPLSLDSPSRRSTNHCFLHETRHRGTCLRVPCEKCACAAVTESDSSQSGALFRRRARSKTRLFEWHITDAMALCLVCDSRGLTGKGAMAASFSSCC